MHYRLLHTNRDFAAGARLNCRPLGDSLVFDAAARVAFLSPVIDAHADRQTWFRLRLAGEAWHAATSSVTVYATDSAHIHVGNRAVEACELTGLTEVSLDDKLAALEPYTAVRAAAAPEISLAGCVGRYLWVALRFEGVSEPFRLDAAYLDLGAAPWERYLPAVYRDEGGTFLPRYLALLQSVYEDTATRIAHRSRLFDPATAPADNLGALLSWVGLERFEACSEPRRRELLAEAADINARRGTKESVVRAVELYLEERAYLLEYDDVQNAAGPRRADAPGLYDIDEYTCILVIAPARPVVDARLRTAAEIAQSMLPAGISLKIVVLSDDFALGAHNYLGMNTRVGTYRELTLDGGSSVSFVRIGKRKDQQA